MDSESYFPEPPNSFEVLAKHGYLDITHGFPFKNGQEIFNFIAGAMDCASTSRFPIVAIQDGDIERVYMLISDLKENRQEHKSLLRELGIPYKDAELMRSVTFTTSIEGFASKPKTGYMNAIVHTENSGSTIYLPIGNGSDLSAAYNIQGFTRHGREVIKSLFHAMGVETR